jgi:hypothetical protein
MDYHWWRVYGPHVVRDGFRGEAYTCASRVPGARLFSQHGVRFSGEGALLLAAARGAARIVLVGYDCQKSAGRAHHHGDHPKTLGNAGKCNLWAGYLAETAARLRDVHVINCSRHSALQAFPRAPLEEALPCPT